MISPLPLNEQQRLEELRRYAVLDTALETALDNVGLGSVVDEGTTFRMELPHVRGKPNVLGLEVRL